MMTASGQPRIMVVEDDEEAREFFVQTLRRGGYEVRQARDGAEALALLYQSPGDLVLLDSCLPDMDGWQLLHQVRVNPLLFDIAAIIVTNQPTDCAGPQPDTWGGVVLQRRVGASHLLEEVERLLRSGPLHGDRRASMGASYVASPHPSASMHAAA